MESNAADIRALGRTLIDTFAKGWTKADVVLQVSVFSPDAIFLETPFSESIKGMDVIRDFWRDVAYHQSDITVTTGEIYAAGPWFSTEFKVTFQRRRTGQWVEARGAIFCETDGAAITEMRMYWHRWNGGKDTSKP